MKAKRKVAKNPKVPFPSLPFIVDDPRHVTGRHPSPRNFWRVTHDRDNTVERALARGRLGGEYAVAFVKFTVGEIEKGGFSLLPHIVSDMPRKLGQIEIAFLDAVARYAAR